MIQTALTRMAVGRNEIQALPKNDTRKQAMTWLIRTRTTMKNKWVGEKLGMGSRVTTYLAVRRFEAGQGAEVTRLKTLLQDLTI